MSFSAQSAEDRYKADVQWNRYLRSRDNGHIEYIEEARKFDRFYVGKQWDPVDLAKLACTGRPALTINTILPTINVVLGEQANKRAEVDFKPKRGSAVETSVSMNKLYKQIMDQSKYDYVESQVFADGLIQDRGYFDVRMDFSKNMQGEIRISHEDPINIVLDPDAKEYDPSTWNEVCKTKWISLDDVELLYGKNKANILRDYVDQGNYYGSDSIEVYEERFGKAPGFPATMRQLEQGNLPERELRLIRTVRVVERQFRVMDYCKFFVDLISGDLKKVPAHWSEKKALAFSETHQLGITEQKVQRIRWTVTSDRVLLHDTWSPYDYFTIVPYFPYFRRGKPFGMVRNLISPQEQLNKVSSQELHVVNSTANSGWKIPTGSLVNMTKDELEERGAETGLVIEFNPAVGEPIRIEPNQVPAGLDHISNKAAMHIKEISGISDAMQGQPGVEVSGVALQAKQARGQIQMQVPMDNLARTRGFVAERVLKLIQSYYTEERTFFLTKDTFNLKPGDPEFEEMIINQKTASGEVVNNVTVGEYEIKISSQPAQDVYNDTQFAEAIELRQAGVMIPDDSIVEYSNLGHKFELAKRIRELNGQGELTPEQQQQQQLMQEIQQKQLQLEMQKLEAEIEKLYSESAENMGQLEIDKAKLQLDAQVQILELKLKAQEMQVGGAVDMRNVTLKAQVDMAKSVLENKTRLETSKLRATARTPNPNTVSKKK